MDRSFTACSVRAFALPWLQRTSSGAQIHLLRAIIFNDSLQCGRNSFDERYFDSLCHDYGRPGMKLIGIRTQVHPEVQVAVVKGAYALPLSTVGVFWTDTSTGLAAASRALADRNADSVELDAVEVVPPVPSSARVICVGLNYRAHAAEGNFEVPAYPTLFGRWTASLSTGGVPAPVPAGEGGLDWEGEIAAYVGTRLAEVTPAQGLAGVLGYSTFNDLTARRAQKLTAQWTLGKNADRSGPLGPLITADEVGDLSAGLRIQTRVNGTVVQDGNTSEMVFGVGEILALISRTFTLHPGDIIATGTPEGVGYVRDPPWLLQPGDVVEVEVDRLGTLRTPIVDVTGRRGA